MSKYYFEDLRELVFIKVSKDLYDRYIEELKSCRLPGIDFHVKLGKQKIVIKKEVRNKVSYKEKVNLSKSYKNLY